MDRVFKLILGLALIGVGLGLAAHGFGQGDTAATLSAYASLLGGCACVLGAIWPPHGPAR